MRGAIFDLDGTIVDNMPVHVEAFAIFAERHGLPPLTLDDRKRLDGRRNREIFPDLFGRPARPRTSSSAFAEEKEALYRDLSVGRLAPVHGLTALLDRLDAHARPGGDRDLGPARERHATRSPSSASSSRLACIVRGDQVARGKPFPDVFLAAAGAPGRRARRVRRVRGRPDRHRRRARRGHATVAVANSFTPDVFLAPPVGADWW